MPKLRILNNARTPEQWAEIIRSKWQDNVQGIFDVGLLLHNSREELGATAFWGMVREKLTYSKFTVTALTKIGTDERLLELFMNNLPASWTTLYDLTKLTDEQLQHGLDSGVIHAGMERKDVAQLKPAKEKLKPTTEVLPIGRELVEWRTMEVRQVLAKALREFSPAEKAEFLDLIQFQVDDLRIRIREAA